MKLSTIYYIENKKKATTYCLAWVCPTFEIHWEKCCGSMQNMYLVTHQISEAILGLLSEIIIKNYLYQKTILRLLSVQIFPGLLFLCQCLVMVTKFCFKHWANLSKLITFYFPWNHQKTLFLWMFSSLWVSEDNLYN